MPRVDTAMRIAGSLSISIDDLVAGMEWRPGYEIVVPGSWEVVERDGKAPDGPRRELRRSLVAVGRDPEQRSAMTAGSRSKTPFPFKALARFADNLYRARELAGLDQKEAAKRAALTRSRLDKIENGEYIPTPRRPDPPRRHLLDLGRRPRQRRHLATRLGRALRAGGVPRLRRGAGLALPLLSGSDTLGPAGRNEREVAEEGGLVMPTLGVARG